MSLCYSKVIAETPTFVREVKNIDETESAPIIQKGTELFLESTKIEVDKNENLWIYCPRNNRYYELYRKNMNRYLIDLFPTIAAEVSLDCKAGLRLYKQATISSNIMDKKSPGENFHISAKFHTDDRGNIWAYCIEIEDTPTGYTATPGWVIYKNKRNNFVNLVIHGRYKVVTTDGELDEDKVEEFRQYVNQIQFDWMYESSSIPLQMFAGNKRGSVKVGGKTDKTKGATNSINAFSGFSAVTPVDGKGKNFSFKHRKRNIKNITTRAKDVVQNSKSFPRHLGKSKGVHVYDYYMDYSRDGLLDDMDKIRRNLNMDVQDITTLFERLTTHYNRFKLGNANDVLSKGFPHVFFTRPDCKFFKDSDGTKLATKPGKDPNIKYIQAHRPALLRQLSQVDGDDWAYLLSNKVASFGTSDESIEVDTYGTTYHKQKIAHGKSNSESKAAGTFSIQMTDTRDLDVLNIHKLWTDYIHNVYHGKWFPKNQYLWKKIIDYAASCYYIITAEDGETIIFWSKYYGIFPTNIPSSSYSWQAGQPIQKTDLSITYQYSFKEDLNPAAMVEFNLNSGITSIDKLTYELTFNPYLGTTGRTWVGKPFIETVKGATNDDFYFKLRFMKGGE